MMMMMMMMMMMTMMMVMMMTMMMVMMMVTQMHLLYPDAADPPALHLAIHPSGFWLLVAAQNLLYSFRMFNIFLVAEKKTIMIINDYTIIIYYVNMYIV